MHFRVPVAILLLSFGSVLACASSEPASAAPGAPAAPATPATPRPGAPSAGETRMLEQPAVSAEHVAFVYAGDLWLADLDGANARRLTSHPGLEFRPRFSPDGKLL